VGLLLERREWAVFVFEALWLFFCQRFGYFWGFSEALCGSFLYGSFFFVMIFLAMGPGGVWSRPRRYETWLRIRYMVCLGWGKVWCKIRYTERSFD
jgi:hypothetical protein